MSFVISKLKEVCSPHFLSKYGFSKHAISDTSIRWISLTLLVFLLFTLPPMVLAAQNDEALNDTPLKGHRITFDYTEVVSLDNDLMEVRFVAHAEGDSATEVNQRINEKMQQANRYIDSSKIETVQTSHYQVNPVYDRNHQLTHWRGQQTLTLTAKTDVNIDSILQGIQKHLAYQDIRFRLSREIRQQAQSQLLDQAMRGYQQKAQQIAKGFGHPTYHLLNTQIIEQNHIPIARYNAPMMMEARVVTNSAPVQEEGKSEVQLQLRGTLLLTD